MNAPIKRAEIVRLESIYPAYRDKMEEYNRAAERDGRKAESIFAEAQQIAKAFWAGAEYAERAGAV